MEASAISCCRYWMIHHQYQRNMSMCIRRSSALSSVLACRKMLMQDQHASRYIELLSHPFINRYKRTGVDLSAYFKSAYDPTEILWQIAHMLAVLYYLIFYGSDTVWRYMKTFYREESVFRYDSNWKMLLMR